MGQQAGRFVVGFVVGCVALAPAAAAPALEVSHMEFEVLRPWPHPDVVPDDKDAQAMLRAGRDHVFALLRVCIDAAGTPTTVALLERSGFAGWDAKLLAAVKAWRYDPLVRDGESRAACARVPISYQPVTRMFWLKGTEEHAVFVGRGLRTTPDGKDEVHVTYDGKRYDTPLATFDGRPSVEGKPVLLQLDAAFGYSLQLWAKPADLAPVLRKPAVLAATASAAGQELPAKAPGLRVDAGAPIAIVGRAGSAVRIELIDEPSRATGWVPKAAVGTRYKTGAFEEPWSNTKMFAERDAELRAAPGGRVLARLVPLDGDAAVQVSVLEDRGDDLLVFAHARRLWAVGWVARRALRTQGRPPSGGPGRKYDLTSPRIALPFSAVVWDKPSGRAIGRTNGDVRAVVRRSAGDHTLVDVDYEGLHIDAWVATPPPASAPVPATPDAPEAKAPAVKRAATPPFDPRVLLPTAASATLSLDVARINEGWLELVMNGALKRWAPGLLFTFGEQCSISARRLFSRLDVDVRGLGDTADPDLVAVGQLVSGVPPWLLTGCFERQQGTANPRIRIANGVLTALRDADRSPLVLAFTAPMQLVAATSPADSLAALVDAIHHGLPLRGTLAQGTPPPQSLAWLAMAGGAQASAEQTALGIRPVALVASATLAGTLTLDARLRLDSAEAARKVVALVTPQLAGLGALELRAAEDEVVLRLALTRAETEAIAERLQLEIKPK